METTQEKITSKRCKYL